MPSENGPDLGLGFAALLFMFLTYTCATQVGCAVKSSHDEPPWIPDTSILITDEKGSAWVGMGERLTPTDPKLKLYYLIPKVQIRELAEKYDRCEAWQ